MRDMLNEIIENIEWAIVLVVFLGLSSCGLAIVAVVWAICATSFLPLLLLVLAAFGGALACGIAEGN